MQLQHGARTECKVVPPVRSAKPFANSMLAVEIRAGDLDHLPPAPVIEDYLRRNRRQPVRENQLPLHIYDEPPPGWKPSERPPAPDSDRGVWEYHF